MTMFPEKFRPGDMITTLPSHKRGFFKRIPKFIIIIAVCIIGISIWHYFRGSKNETNAQVVTQSKDETLDFKVQEPISLEEQESKDFKPFEYEVESGDTLSSIAKQYNLKLSTILWANDLTEKSLIKPGQTITLLPVDGVLHKIEKGETISQIAKIHKGDVQKTIAYNQLDDGNQIFPGDLIIVPDGQPEPKAPPVASNKAGSLAVGIGKLFWPTNTRNLTQGYSSQHRGIDISNGTRGPVYAAHGGTVIFSGHVSDWGNTIVIRGENGLSTRYSHHTENYVQVGDKVSVGEKIAKVGNTGNVRGATGIHLDFRVYKNGVAINPLSVLK